MHGDSVNCPKCDSVMDEFADMDSHRKVPTGGRGRVHNILVCPSCGHEQLSDKVIFFNNTNLFYDGDPFPESPGNSAFNDNSVNDYNPYTDDFVNDYDMDDIYLDDYDSDYYSDTYSESGGFDFFLFLMYFAPMIIFIIILALFV